ncbi:uncharacterized protein B0H18DRAFT_666134 [Fomitopsis serialis]|uniref:uncharacterized protein n=1 Tax=Fomitopsis serialis TaxID=139415 RepID=UPI002007F3CC|nr:uncharacterized protein B0H18DRAFT_667442 [Neoantrodia serialis]XP_047889046.1 uncharacterized protein B0H18DRAFT_666134 [Neoantrodia serialis]KAH9918506.1 hypothetical protein B0H18DRAFT_667442 [Neoantrodia serialis]KAH9918624.1 hypothetical protein B0H18DRAFT_666134 [Neoantrodia serialis]
MSGPSLPIDSRGSQTRHHRQHAPVIPSTPFRLLPIELFEEIIAWVPYSTLPAVISVCRAWHGMTINLLYSTVELCSRESFTMLAEQLHTSARVKCRLATTCRLVVSDRAFPKTPSEANRDACNHFLHALPPVFCTAMTGLQTLQIDGAYVLLCRRCSSSPFPCSRQ